METFRKRKDKLYLESVAESVQGALKPASFTSGRAWWPMSVTPVTVANVYHRRVFHNMAFLFLVFGYLWQSVACKPKPSQALPRRRRLHGCEKLGRIRRRGYLPVQHLQADELIIPAVSQYS